MISISPGISVLAAGLVSGLCFIIVTGLRRGRASSAAKETKQKQSVDVDCTRCACCLKPFLVERGVQCEECGARSCRKGCSRWNTPENAWYCLFCHQRRLWLRRNEKWFETFGGLSADHGAATHRFSTAKSQVILGGADYAGVGPGVGLAAGGEEEEAGDSVERVREFVEKIVESLVGDVDEIPIDRLYDHQAYDELVENYKEPLAGALARLAISLQLSISNKPATDAPTMAHAALRDLVERAVEEAKKLPGLGGSDAGRSADQEPSDISEQTYEDLLATAILNKVIEKYQHERVDGNSNTLHDNKSAPRAKYITSEIEVGLDEGVEEGSSSLEPLSQDEYSSDCSAPAPKYNVTRQEPLSLTIEEHIEEVTTTYTSDEEEERDNEEANELDFRKAHRVPFPEYGMDIIDPSQESSEETPDEATAPTHVDLVTPVESWEENWLFQKKKMQAQSEPVSMLVPNPSEDFKPLIGDREADDTSDLSDCSAQSDEEIEEELLEAINNVALKTPETPEAKESTRPSLDVEELVEIRSNGTRIEETRVRTESGKTTITIGDRNSNTTNVQTMEIHTSGISRVQLNGEGEQKAENLTSQGKEVKSGLEEMLVHHLSKDRSSKTGNGHSAEFIEREKSTVQEIDDVDGGAIGIKRSQSEIQHLITDAMQIVETQVKTNENVDHEVELAQVTRDFRIVDNLQGRSSDVEPVQLDPLKDQVVEDVAVISGDKDQSLILDDDIQTENVPRTPTSSPLRLSETSATETGPHIDLRSLDEKLVSIETRDDKKLNSFEEAVNNVQKTEVVQSLSSVTNSTVKDHVVEARLVFVTSGSKIGNDSAKNEIQNEDGAQQESEYTEHYATATQRHLDSLRRPSKTIRLNEVQISNDNHDDDDDIPPPIPSTPPPIARLKKCRRAAALATVEIDEPLAIERKRVEVDLSLATPPRPGTIAEREHKKWENAVPIENNPYSEENIQKRLWQRQYSRKMSSDTSAGESSETPKAVGTPLQVVLGAGQPDVKRYGRDYYINDAKRASGERVRRSAMLNSGRPNSSLSQNSGSYDDDLEPQELSPSQTPEMISNAVTEVKSKVSSWQQNNIADSDQNVVLRSRHRVEATIHLGSGSDQVDGNELKIRSTQSSISEVDNSWGGQNAEELLENVRRNSKNELNAKLNNQEDPERISVVETRKSLVSDGQKSINRIDLKAYGFANEIKHNGSSTTKIAAKRVVNKLDLRSFGYDADLKRIQSTGQIDEKLNNEISARPRIVKMKTKSNLTEHHVDSERSKSSHNLVEYVEASGDFDKTKSTEIFNEDKNFTDRFQGFGGMTSAKSMPNVAKIDHYSQNLSGIRGYKDEEELIVNQLATKTEKFREDERLRQEMIKASAKSQGLWKSETTLFTGEKTLDGNDFNLNEDLEDLIVTTKYTEVLSKKEIFEKQTGINTSSSRNVNNDDDLPMPSVRRLAQTFIKPIDQPSAQPRVLKTYGNVRKERPTTPEVHIIETPRQMHSLTARSISREFREGLRQIPNKIPSPSTSHITIEQSTVIVKNKPEVVVTEVDNNNVETVATIASGKLKNNIKFWEQLQNKQS